MRMSTEERVAAPADWVFARLSHAGGLERAARARGAEVTRLRGERTGPGTAWRVAAQFRGMRREAEAAVTRHEPPRELRVEGGDGALTGAGTLVVTPEGPGACRIGVTAEIGASGLKGQALLQPLKLARGRIEDRLARQVEDVAVRLGERYARTRGAGPQPAAASRLGSAG